MRILLPLILMLCGSAFAVTGYSLPNDFSAGDTIKASKIMANYRAGSTWSTANADSLETKFMRFSDAKDTLFDTLKAKRVRASTELISSGTLTTAGLATVDSLHSVKGISGTNVWMTGTIFTDSIYANSGINAATADFTEVNSSGHVNGTTGGFSSTMTVDSLKSTKGISATTGRFSGALSGTTLTASGTATVDSLASTKGAYIGGKVGIGRIPTTHTVEVQGGVYAYGNGATAYILSHRSTGERLYIGGEFGKGGIGTESDHPLQFSTNNTLALTIGTDQSATFAGKIVPTAIATPANPAASAMQFYFKGSKFILQYNDGGTQRWKYLDLAGTGVTWVHSTSAP